MARQPHFWRVRGFSPAEASHGQTGHAFDPWPKIAVFCLQIGKSPPELARIQGPPRQSPGLAESHSKQPYFLTGTRHPAFRNVSIWKRLGDSREVPRP